MKKVGIVTDSHSGIGQQEAKEMGIMVLPMPFYFEEECLYEDISITREAFFEKLNSGIEVTTSQPAPAEVMGLWDKALEIYDEILYIPISSGLSGSCSTSYAISKEPKYDGRVYVVDAGRVSTLLHCAILDALRLIEEGHSAAAIRDALENARDKMSIYIGVETLEFLKRGGRITPTVATIGTVLNIKPVLKLDVGTLDAYKNCRGFSKAKKVMIEAMKYELETQYKGWYQSKDMYLLAASSASEEETKQWIADIEEAFPGFQVMCDNLSLGVCCHTGQGALGIGFSSKIRIE
ncbi:MAG: DegV family protein [Lachnospiraceae bacterium]|nr:DegV family protein [Lachnospiraceae bacterium]